MTDALVASVIVALSLGISTTAVILLAVFVARQQTMIHAQGDALARMAGAVERVTGEHIEVPTAPSFLPADLGTPPEDLPSFMPDLSPWRPAVKARG